jgi:hypothetical protein
VKLLSDTRDSIAAYILSSRVTGESQVTSPCYPISKLLTWTLESNLHILRLGNCCCQVHQHLCMGGSRYSSYLDFGVSTPLLKLSSENLRPTVVACTNFITQIDMDIRDVNHLNRSFSAHGRTFGVWFSSHGNCISLDIWPLAKAEDGQTEELRGACANRHLTKIVGENRSLEGNSTLTMLC